MWLFPCSSWFTKKMLAIHRLNLFYSSVKKTIFSWRSYWRDHWIELKKNTFTKNSHLRQDVTMAEYSRIGRRRSQKLVQYEIYWQMLTLARILIFIVFNFIKKTKNCDPLSYKWADHIFIFLLGKFANSSR